MGDAGQSLPRRDRWWDARGRGGPIPGSGAIVATDTRITYAELNADACRVARAPGPRNRQGEDARIAHCRGRFASLKVLRHVRIVADAPRTPGAHSDTVQTGKLRELFLAEIAGSGGRPEVDGA